MALQYVAEKLFAAVETLASGTSPLRERLEFAYLDSVSRVRLHADCLPERARQVFDAIQASVTQLEPEGELGSISVTIRAMSDRDAARVVQQIILLLQLVSWELAGEQKSDGKGWRFPYEPSVN
jgi:hypothetical protein